MKRIFTLLLSLVLASSAMAQKEHFDPSSWGLLDGKTIVKANITSPIFRNYSFAAERILTPGLGVQLGLNTMPRGGLPLVPAEGTLGLSEEYSLDFGLSSFALTPELRWYTGGGYGHGFYLMAYYRFQNYGLSNYSYDFHVTPESGSSATGTLVVDGKLSTHSLGFGLGVQWLLGRNKNIVLDWNILGAHIGQGNLSFSGKYFMWAGRRLSQREIQSLKSEILNPLDSLAIIKQSHTELEVDEHNQTVELKNLATPWAFFRMSVSVGFRF